MNEPLPSTGFKKDVLAVCGLRMLLLLFALSLLSGNTLSGAALSGSGPPFQLSHTVGGRVVESETGEPLAFVNIVVHGTRSGGMSDIDGFFSITHSQPVEALLLSHVGFLPAVHQVAGDPERQRIEMTRGAVDLDVVEVYPGENPAHRIIRHVMDNRDANNPEKRGAFSYHSYNKFLFTGEFDTGEDEPLAKDSVTVRLNRYLADHHFFLMETVTERRFMPPSRDNETILASRVSGFKNPALALLMTQVQSFSFYNNQIEISGNRYLSPLAPGSLDRYFFLLEDTTYVGTDTVFIISYRPSRNRNFDGLQGTLYVNSNGWALQNVIAQPAGETGNARIRIRQRYELVDGKAWFPTQLNTDFELANLDDLNNFRVLGTGRTYLQDIRLDASLRRRDFSPFRVEFSPATLVDDSQYWDKFRTDSLTARERNTYDYLDSLSAVNNLDRRMESIEALLSGEYRLGSVDLSLAELLGWSRAEGFRTALSLQTNQRFSRRAGFTGLLAYGFGDERVKYGGGGYVVLDHLLDLRLGYDYRKDLAERGGSSFMGPRQALSTDLLRRFFLETMDMHERHQVWVQGRTWRNFLTLRAYASAERVDQAFPFPDYCFPFPFQAGEQRYFETGLQFRLAYGEQFILTPERILSMGTEVPVLHFNLARGWEGPFGAQYPYWRLEAMFQKRFPIRMHGNQQFTVKAGWVDGPVPWTRLFTAPAAYARFGFSVPGAFSVMRMDEFVSDRYVALFWQHDFENLLYRSGNFNPRLVLLTNAGIGWQRASHFGSEALPGPMEKGYFESGLAVQDLYRLGFTRLGLEFMYRYGPYGLPSFRENFSLRISYSMGF